MMTNRRSDAGLLWGGLLIALGAVLLAQTTGVVPGWASVWFGAAVLAAMGLAFLVVYLTAPARWWAVIPAGALFSLAIATGAGPFVQGAVAGAIFLFGLAATFGAVALVPAAGPPRTWAWVPAAVLAVLGAVALGSTAVAAVFWPVLLILAGAYLVVVWATRRQPRG